MIFSRFFVPPHASKDPVKRLDSVKKLDPSVTKSKQILHELAFNDDNTEVSLAALHKLNSFPLWLKMAQIAGDEKIRNAAEKVLVDAINSTTSLSVHNNELVEFLLQHKNVSLICALLESDRVKTLSIDEILQLLGRVGKPHYTIKFLTTVASAEVVQGYVEQCDDQSLLAKLVSKLAKHASSDSLLTCVQQRIAALVEAQQRPVKIENDSVLVLSKLQAVLDKHNWEEVREISAALTAEYEVLAADYALLSDEVSAKLISKYELLSERLQRHKSRLEQVWQDEQNERQRQLKIADATREFNDIAKLLDSLYQQPLTATSQDIVAVQQRLVVFNQHIQTFARAEHALFSQQVSMDQLNTLEAKARDITVHKDAAVRIDEWLNSIDASIESVDSIESEESDNSSDWENIDNKLTKLSAEYRALTRELKQPIGALNTRWNRVRKTLSERVKAIKQESQQQLQTVKKLIHVVDSLIEQGKFKAAMERFTRLQAEFADISESSPSYLVQRFQATQTQIERLQGWQSYLSAPRKPALLDEAKALPEISAYSAEEVKQRAEQIRYLRSQWLSLGVLNTPDDEVINLEFDRVLEKAFEPCRQFYAQQEQRSKIAEQEKRDLIDQLQAVDVSKDSAALFAIVNELKDKWRNTGQVDRKVYEGLKQRWSEALKPMDEKIAQWLSDNAAAKQALIDKLELLNSEVSGDTAEQAKQLQQQWRNIGSAGKARDGKLWRTFKKLNDAFFTELKAQNKAQSNAQAAEYDKLLAAIKADEARVSEVEFSEMTLRIEQYEASIKAVNLARNQQRKLFDALEVLHTKAKHVIQKRDRQAAEQQISTLLSLLASEDGINTSQNQALLDSLPKLWVDALAVKSPPEKSRHWYTVQLEVLCEISNQEDESLRQDVQLALLTAKMNNGSLCSIDDTIVSWLSHGVLLANDRPLLARFGQCLRCIADERE